MVFLTKSGSLDGVVQLIVVIIMFLFVLALAYFTARLVGRFQGNVQNRSNIKVLESARIANNKYIQIVKIGERYFAIGVGKDNLTYLAELEEDDLNMDNLNHPSKGSFKDILSQLQKKKDENENDETQ